MHDQTLRQLPIEFAALNGNALALAKRELEVKNQNVEHWNMICMVKWSRFRLALVKHGERHWVTILFPS